MLFSVTFRDFRTSVIQSRSIYCYNSFCLCFFLFTFYLQSSSLFAAVFIFYPLFFFLSFSLSQCFCVFSLSHCNSHFLSVYLFLSLPILLGLSQSLSLSLRYFPLFSLSLSLSPFFSLFQSLSFYLFFSLSLSLSLSLTLSSTLSSSLSLVYSASVSNSRTTSVNMTHAEIAEAGISSDPLQSLQGK